jgi:hypothetical protein
MDLHAQRQFAIQALPANWVADMVIAHDGAPFLSVRVRAGRQHDVIAKLREAGLPGPYEVVEYPIGARRPNPSHPSEPVAPYRYPVEPPISGGQLVGELEQLLGHAGLLSDGGPPAQVWLWDPLDREHARNPRRYAQVIPELRRFEFARATLQLPWCNRLGLLAHEVGHVLDPNASEAKTDKVAERALGIKIGYDRRWPGKGLQVAKNC